MYFIWKSTTNTTEIISNVINALLLISVRYTKLTPIAVILFHEIYNINYMNIAHASSLKAQLLQKMFFLEYKYKIAKSCVVCYTIHS